MRICSIWSPVGSPSVPRWHHWRIGEVISPKIEPEIAAPIAKCGSMPKDTPELDANWNHDGEGSRGGTGGQRHHHGNQEDKKPIEKPDGITPEVIETIYCPVFGSAEICPIRKARIMIELIFTYHTGVADIRSLKKFFTFRIPRRRNQIKETTVPNADAGVDHLWSRCLWRIVPHR